MKQGVSTSKLMRKENFVSWGILAPTLVYYTIFSIVPLVILVGYSLTDMYGLAPELAEFIGLDNYIQIFTDIQFWQIMKNTLVMSVISMVSSIVIGFFVAVLLSKPIKCRGAFRTAWYIPSLVAIGVISQMLSVLLKSDGLLNNMLRKFGILGESDFISWVNSSFWMNFWIIILCIWRGLGGNMLLFMAGLTGIPTETIEAAQIDGANSAQILFKIKIPLIKPMFSFVIINSVVAIFGLFEPIQLISEGGPNGTTNTIMYEIYNRAFKNYEQGYASAMSVIVLVITLALTVLSVRISRSSSEE